MKKNKSIPKIIKWKRKCSFSMEGINEGWYIETYGFYLKHEKDAVRVVREFGYKSIQHAFDEGFIYYTDWYQDEDEYFSYSKNGKAIDLKEWNEYKNLKTLVIHPSDPTTMFLRPSYEDKGWDVIDKFIDEVELIKIIQSYDRIICMGHGIAGGMLAPYAMIFTTAHVPIIRDKKFISIWCNSDMFVEFHRLEPQLFTGMIVSEVPEAMVYSLPVDEDLVDESNELFASALERFIEYPYPAELIKSVYKSDTNPIIQFNHQRIYS